MQKQGDAARRLVNRGEQIEIGVENGRRCTSTESLRRPRWRVRASQPFVPVQLPWCAPCTSNPFCRPCTGLPFRMVAADREHGKSTCGGARTGAGRLCRGRRLHCASQCPPLNQRGRWCLGDRLSAKRAGGLPKGNAGGSGHRRREAAHAAAQKCAPQPSSHGKIVLMWKGDDYADT